jgi:hypothetical protein
MTVHNLPEDLRFSLELLIARSTYDLELRHSLLTNPEHTLLTNDICPPPDFQIAFTEDPSKSILTEAFAVILLPVIQKTQTTNYTNTSAIREFAASALNGAVEEVNTVTTEDTVTQTTVATAAELAGTGAVEAAVTNTTEAAEAETTVFVAAEAVVVAT